jgi:hypothetical protein
LALSLMMPQTTGSIMKYISAMARKSAAYIQNSKKV